MKIKLKNRNGRRMASPVEAIAKLKLDLSFGDLPPGFQFLRADFDPIRTQPWPLKDESVEEIYSAFLLNRVPGNQRFAFMDELWRVLIPGGKATVIVPYWTSYRSVQDPLSQWPSFCEQSFLYFNRQFRQTNRIYPEVQCDFDFVYGHTLDPETASRNDDTRPFWIKHYANAAADLQLVLTKRGQTVEPLIN